MMFSDPEYIESNLIAELDFLDQVIDTLRCAECTAALSMRRREAIDADLHATFCGSGLLHGEILSRTSSMELNSAVKRRLS